MLNKDININLIHDLVYSHWAISAFVNTRPEWENTLNYIKGLHDMAIIQSDADCVNLLSVLRGVAIWRAANALH